MNQIEIPEIKIVQNIGSSSISQPSCIWFIGNIHNDDDIQLSNKRYDQIVKHGIRIVGSHKYGNYPLIQTIEELSMADSNNLCRILIMYYHDEIADQKKIY